MGRDFIDRFSLLHFATGIVAQYWGTPLWLFILGHIAFEIFESTRFGMALFNRLPFLKGLSGHSTWTNIVGDNLCAWAGWALASYVNDVA